MKISGFTIVRKGVTFGYPFVESIRSLLPLVDELVVGVGDGDDGTYEAVRKIGDPKLKLFRSAWDLSRREGGLVLSAETNKALARCKGDWGMYLQADEVLHEDDLDSIRAAMARHLKGPTEGLSFDYLHFYGSYQTLQDQRRKWYRKAVRAVKLGGGVESVGDAYGFKVKGRSLLRAASDARIFHYGWCRPPQIMLEKQANLDRMYHDEAWVESRHQKAREDLRRFYEDRGNLKFFRGSHPAAMNRRVAAQGWSFDHLIALQAPDWLRRLYTLLLYPIAKRWAR